MRNNWIDKKIIRVDRVAGFLTSRPNWLPPPPHMHTRLRESGQRESIRTKGQTIWYSTVVIAKTNVAPKKMKIFSGTNLSKFIKFSIRIKEKAFTIQTQDTTVQIYENPFMFFKD
jgi:hypothetical protein